MSIFQQRQAFVKYIHVSQQWVSTQCSNFHILFCITGFLKSYPGITIYLCLTPCFLFSQYVLYFVTVIPYIHINFHSNRSLLYVHINVHWFTLTDKRDGDYFMSFSALFVFLHIFSRLYVFLCVVILLYIFSRPYVSSMYSFILITLSLDFTSSSLFVLKVPQPHQAAITCTTKDKVYIILVVTIVNSNT